MFLAYFQRRDILYYILEEIVKEHRMKKNKVISLITIIAVIAVAGVFFGVNYLLDAYAKYQRATQSGNQAAAG